MSCVFVYVIALIRLLNQPKQRDQTLLEGINKSVEGHSHCCVGLRCQLTLKSAEKCSIYHQCSPCHQFFNFCRAVAVS